LDEVMSGEATATPETLRQWIRKAEIDAGERPG
jgi:hypothetical protein